MKKALKIIALILFLAFVGIQFVRPARVNLPIAPEQTLEANAQVPDEVQQIFRRSCNDCHTNQANWRWYSHIAPISWGMVEHVEDGRAELNFSEWANYETPRKRRKLDEICEQVQTKEMPLNQYLWVHWDAKLSDAEIKKVCDWTEAERARLEKDESTSEK
jgi:hypothetical protein